MSCTARLSALLGLLLFLPVGSARADDVGTAPVSDPRWSFPTIREEQVRRWLLQDAVKSQQDRGRPILPAAEPLAAGSKVLFRSHRGIHAVNLVTGKLEWEFDSSWSLDVMARETLKSNLLRQWVSLYLTGGQVSFLYDNAVLGHLSTDGKQVYAVDDLALAPFPGAYRFANAPFEPNFGSPVNDAAYHSRLQAYSLTTGKLLWEVGGRGGKDELHDTFFLSAPLLHDGKLLVPIEKAGGIALVALEPADGKLVWQLDLAAARNRLHLDPARRLRGVRLALADDILLCQLGDTLVGVEMASRSVLWAHTPLREQPAVAMGRAFPQQPVPLPRADLGLTASSPALARDRVIFNVPGGRSLICLNVKDGSVAWRAAVTRDDAALAGVVRDRVLLIGRRGLRALNAADGKPLWSIETGEPSGRGAVSGTVYHLPLRAEARSKRPGVVTVDVDHGEVVAFAAEAEVPGNLVLHERDVLSQALDRVAVFPQARFTVEQMNERVSKSPKDPILRAARGDLRLGVGDTAGAVEDYRAALANDPPMSLRAKVRAGLCDGLVRLLERDFAAGEKHLAEYETLCKEDAAEGGPAAQRRQAEIHYLVGRGRDQQGRMRDAVRAYLQYLATAPDGDTAAVAGEPALRAQRFVWVGARLDTLLERAAVTERRPLEDEIERAWKSLRDDPGLDAMRALVQRLGGGSAVDAELRLAMANRLIEAKLFLEAELLLQTRSPRTDTVTAARMLEALAKLSLTRGLPEEAADLYRRLGREFATVKVRDTLTGADLLREAASDRRLLAYLDETSASWPRKARVAEVKPGDLVPRQRFLFEPHGEPLPWVLHHRFGLDFADSQFKVTDSSGREEWAHPLTRSEFPTFAAALNADLFARNTCRVQGHLIVLALGSRVFGLDPLRRRMLWERSLFGRETLLPGSVVAADPRDVLPQIVYPDGTTQKIGQVAAVTPVVVCVQTLDGLLGLDPQTGSVLWQRSDVEPGGNFFHDEEHLFFVNTDAGRTTQAFRLRDGGTVKVPDCSGVFANRLGQVGRTLLLSGSENGFTVRSYDALTGKDVWQRSFAAGSQAVRSEDAEVVGVLGPDRRLTVLEAASGKEMAVLSVDPAQLEGVRELRLLADATHFYLAASTPPSADLYVAGTVQSNWLPGCGLRSLLVNGSVSAFQRDGGKLAWRTEVAPQYLLLTQFRDLPVLIFTGRAQKLAGAVSNRTVIPITTVTVIDRRTGKLLFDRPEGNGAGPYFHALYWDVKGRRIDLVGASSSVRMAFE